MGKLSFKALSLSESQIEMQICHYLHSKRLFFWKTISTGFFDTKRKVFRKQHNPFALSGIPDILICYEGRLIGWEIKTPKGIQSENQKLFESRLVSEGKGRYAIIRSLEEAVAELKRIPSSIPCATNE